MKIGCIVMAAGKGVRFGRNKLVEEIGGTPMLARTCKNIPSDRFERMVVVVSSDRTAELCRIEAIPFVQYSGGPQSETVRIGMRSMMDLDGCMFFMGDQPLCGRKSIDRMLDAFEETPDHVIRLSSHGVASSPTIFPSSTFPALCSLEGEQGGMAALKQNKQVPIRLIEAENEEEIADVDTVSDAEAMNMVLRGE